MFNHAVLTRRVLVKFDPRIFFLEFGLLLPFVSYSVFFQIKYDDDAAWTVSIDEHLLLWQSAFIFYINRSNWQIIVYFVRQVRRTFSFFLLLLLLLLIFFFSSFFFSLFIFIFNF